jgi:OOP family OmpA-OmpF porin
VAIAPASPAKTASSAPEAVTPDLPEAPMLPVVVAEARALFDFDSAELTSLGKETLDSWLATAPVGMPVVVSGHADRLGPEDYNLELSLRRATAARDYLVAKGKDVRDIRIVAKGELEPVKRCKGGPTDATKACLAPNRRVLITPE